MAEVRRIGLAGQSNALHTGVDIGIAETLAPLGPFELVKYAVGGTGLCVNAAVDWNPASVGELYDDFVEDMQDRATNITTQGHTAPIEGVIFIQGEYDAANSTCAFAYQANLTSFISSLRTDLSAPSLKVVIVQLNDQTNLAYEPTVRIAQAAVDASDPNVFLYDPSALPMRIDNLHYPVESYEIIGREAIELLDPVWIAPASPYDSLSTAVNITGTAGADTIETGIYDDTISAGASNDIVTADFGDNVISLGDGGDYVATGSGNDSIDAGIGNDNINPFNNAGSYIDGASESWMRNNDIDTVFAGDGNDVLLDYAGDGNEIDMGTGNDTVTAGAYRDTVHGGTGTDSMNCGAGDDYCSGDADADTIDSGAGTDLIAGGTGADRFVFSTVEGDAILDFATGSDQIDLSAMDANINTIGDQAFTVAASFTGTAGQLVIEDHGASKIIKGDTDGDGDADFTLVVMGSPISTDFIL